MTLEYQKVNTNVNNQSAVHSQQSEYRPIEC